MSVLWYILMWWIFETRVRFTHQVTVVLLLAEIVHWPPKPLRSDFKPSTALLASNLSSFGSIGYGIYLFCWNTGLCLLLADWPTEFINNCFHLFSIVITCKENLGHAKPNISILKQNKHLYHISKLFKSSLTFLSTLSN